VTWWIDAFYKRRGQFLDGIMLDENADVNKEHKKR